MPRDFGLGGPRVRIWNSGGTAVERECVLDAAANGYHIDYWNYDREDDAETSIAESGKAYPHVRGYRLHAVVSFSIYHPNYAPDSGFVPMVTGFTEADLAAMDNALLAGQDIEFYVHALASYGSEADDGHLVEYRVTSSGRAEGNWRHDLTIEFTGIHTATTRPTEL